MRELARRIFERSIRQIESDDRAQTEARREVAKRYYKEAESSGREAKRQEKAQTDLAKRCEQLEACMRQA